MRTRFIGLTIGLSVLCSTTASATTQVSVGIGLPGVSIGINLPAYPQFVLIPGYPVYYAPGLNANFFFYDGMYWVFQGDNWYASYWYNGPWGLVEPNDVPLFVLRVPVRYYRVPPPYFRGWHRDAPPHWGEHWGSEWEIRRHGWDRWDRHAAPPPAPLPRYQQHYSGDRYPQRFEEQQDLRQRNYRYAPRDPAIRRRQQEYPPPQHIAPPSRRDSTPAPQNRQMSPGDSRGEHAPGRKRGQSDEPPH